MAFCCENVDNVISEWLRVIFFIERIMLMAPMFASGVDVMLKVGQLAVHPSSLIWM